MARKQTAPMGERVASLEATVPTIKEAMEKGFETLTGEVGKLATSVQNLVDSETARLAVETERKRNRGRRDAVLIGASGSFGSVLTYCIDLFRHHP